MTRTFEQIVGYTTNFAFYTTSYPMKWNLRRHRLEPGPVLLEYWWLFLCFMNATWRLIVSIIFVVNVISFNITGARIILCFTMWCLLSISILIHYALCFKIVDWRDMVDHINDLIKMDKKFELLRKQLENSGTSNSDDKRIESKVRNVAALRKSKANKVTVESKRTVDEVVLNKMGEVEKVAQKRKMDNVTCKNVEMPRKNKRNANIHKAVPSCKEAFELEKFAKVIILAAIWSEALACPLVLFLMIFEYDIFRGIASETSFEFNFFMAAACTASLYCDAFLIVVAGSLTMYHCKFVSFGVKLIR